MLTAIGHLACGKLHRGQKAYLHLTFNLIFPDLCQYYYGILVLSYAARHFLNWICGGIPEATFLTCRRASQ
jgi:hypothetical protein